MPRIPDDTRDAVLAAIRAGQHSRAAIARQYGVSRASVTNIAQQAGVIDAFDRSATQKATAAAQADHHQRLALLAGRNITVAEAILDSFDSMSPEQWAEQTLHARGVVLGILQDKARDLSPPDERVEAAKSAIAGIVDAIRDGWRD